MLTLKPVVKCFTYAQQDRNVSRAISRNTRFTPYRQFQFLIILLSLICTIISEFLFLFIYVVIDASPRLLVYVAHHFYIYDDNHRNRMYKLNGFTTRLVLIITLWDVELLVVIACQPNHLAAMKINKSRRISPSVEKTDSNLYLQPPVTEARNQQYTSGIRIVLPNSSISVK